MIRCLYAGAAAGLLLTGCTTAETQRVYFGTSRSKGIYFSDFDTQTGQLTEPKLAVEAKNCGFIAIHPDNRLLYSTETSAYSINEDGTLTLLNTQTTDGKGSCHVSIDQTGNSVMVAYYGSGGAASFRIQEDGALSEAVSYYQHEGSGEHPKRQTGPHAHSIFPNPGNTHAYVPDLGIDEVVIYELDGKSGRLTSAGSANVPGGSMGPRHMKFNNDGSYAYVLSELDLSVSVYKAAENGQLEFIKTLSVLPEDADRSEMSCAEIRIHPNGKYIYTSNRDLTDKDRDSISIFTRFEDGFQRLETVPAEVWIPRNFNLDPSGKWLIVGGQRSKDLAIFKVDPETGMIRFTGNKVPFEGGPICIEFLN